MGISQEEIQDEIAKAQQLEQQLQAVMNQKQQLQVKSKDLEKALDELERLDEEATIYQEVGEILVKVEDNEEMIDELKEDKETTDVRLDSLENKEEKLRDQFQDLQQKLSSQLGGLQQGGGPMGGA